MEGLDVRGNGLGNDSGYKEGSLCTKLNSPEVELAQYTIQDGTEGNRYESLALGLLDESKGSPSPKYPY